MNIWELFEKGGFLMYPIVLCSIISLAVLLERFWSLRRSKVTPGLDFIFHLAKTADKKSFELEIKKRDDYLSKILSFVIDDDTDEDPVKLTEMYGKRVSVLIYSYTSIPGILATISPLMGLLGTIIGMMRMFSRFNEAGGNPMVLAGGIWEALITTAAGLIVAIPSLIIYRFLSYKADKTVSEIEFALEKILLYLTGKEAK